MGALVLVVGALLLAAGGYELYAGSSNILSERGWSAFIAGSVLLTGGVVTMAVGLALRAIDGLRSALLQGPVGQGAIFRDQGALVRDPPAGIGRGERIEPGSMSLPSDELAPPSLQPDLFSAPQPEPASAHPPLAIEHAETSEPYPAVAMSPPHEERIEPHPDALPVPPEPRHDDWLDQSFAELERETSRHQEPVPAATIHAPATPASDPAPIFAAPEPPVRTAPFDSNPLRRSPAPAPPAPPPVVPVIETPYVDRPATERPAFERPATDAHDVGAPHDDFEAAAPVPHPSVIDHGADQATVSAREVPAPATSAVIGRYESEGTSYVMYADGSIDAQSEAGVYRFTSMAELKAFIES